MIPIFLIPTVISRVNKRGAGAGLSLNFQFFFSVLFQSTNDQKTKQLRDLTQLCLSIGILFLVCESPRSILPIYHRFIDKSLAVEYLQI